MTIASLKPKRDYFEHIALREHIAQPMTSGAFRIPIAYNPCARPGEDDYAPVPNRRMDYLLVLPPPGHPEWLTAELALWKCAARCGLKTVDAALIKLLDDGSAALLYEIRGHNRLKGQPAPDTVSWLGTWGAELKKDELVPADLLGRLLAWNCAFPRFAAVDFFDLVLFAYLTGDCDQDKDDFCLNYHKAYNGFALDGGFHFLPRKVLESEECEDFDMLLSIGTDESAPAPQRFHDLALALKLTEGQYERRVKLLTDSIHHFLEGALDWAKVPPELKERLTTYCRAKCAEFGG